MEITKTNAKDLWMNAINTIEEKGRDFNDNDNRVCREINNLTLTIKNVDEAKIDEPIKTMINSKNWIYPTKEELSSIMFKEYSAPIYEYTYGGRIFNFNNEIDQINTFILPLLKKDPNTRRAILVFYNPKEDSKPENKNTPGIIYIQFRIINNKLNLTSHIRSNDLFFGWPANLYQIYCLMQHITNRLEIQNGNITTFSNSGHIFLDDIQNMKEILNEDL
ncbi:MAG: thymidylate synthase [Candidatus Woesearchaeota archaeon]